MKRNPQGRRWHRLDNTGKLFPLIASENLSNVFRISVLLKENIKASLLEEALKQVLPRFPGFQVKLKRGFFWYYFEENRNEPYVEQESSWPCRYIDPKSGHLYLFRVSYYEKRINLEVFHAVTDGMGAVNFLRELTVCYLDLKNGRKRDAERQRNIEAGSMEDSYLAQYRRKLRGRGKEKHGTEPYSSRPALSLTGSYIPFGGESVVHGYVNTAQLKQVCRGLGVSITKYLTACLIWAIFMEYGRDHGKNKHIGVNLPVNLRAFFGSTTDSNFFAVTGIDYHLARSGEFQDILREVCRQMDEKIVKEKLEETISYNVSRERKWYVRILPLVVKGMALGMIFRRNDRAHTITLSNIGPVSVEERYEREIASFQMMIGVSKRQPAKCGVCSFGEKTVITFTKVFQDTRLEERFFGKLREDGIDTELESNGVVLEKADRHRYPVIQHDRDLWKQWIRVCYGVLAALAVLLGVVNAISYDGLWWAGIAVPAVIFVALTLRYSILRHANLGKAILIQTIGIQIVLLMTDWVSGAQGWSANYGVPASILFADAAIVLLILVNRLNWQSYFMYQLSITVFSFIPLLLWALGLITRPLFSIVSIGITVGVLVCIVFLGDRRFKKELIRRFHL